MAQKVYPSDGDMIAEPNPYSEEASKAWIDRNSDPKTHVRSGRWTPEKGAEGPAIPTHYTIAVHGEACGGIGLVFGQDVYFRTAELGYWLSQEHWGKGVMSRVVPAFLEWSWKTFGVLVRLNSGAYDFNSGSQRVLDKAGFVYEGRRADIAYKDGRIVGEVLYGALRPGGPEM
ncbi:N-acetyltransferase GCN5 like [Lecanosticta acicola]|uniref:N-acetyltransferase GCN5 like n=1 Tax=Lecanosticta acicola TaxID=111012 RepID=A0AAI8YXP6_9PEZI|nr:N-acetyltransferase GCN5 like [Lecanosticta acicola]